jgi:cyanate permease
MQRVWTIAISVWAMLAIVAVLAWSHRPALASSPQPTAQSFVIRTVNGKPQLVLVHNGALGATHGTTSTSAVPR